MQQIPCSENGKGRRRVAARNSTAYARATSFMRRRPRARHHEASSVTWLQRSASSVIMRRHMRSSIRIRTHAPRRDEKRRRAARVAAIALALAAFHLARAHDGFVAKAHAQGLAPAVPSTPDPTDLVRAELVSDAAAVAPGRPFHLAVRLAIKEGWHVNWLNPGDAGLAPGVSWRVPKGFKTTVMCWPYPERFPTGPLVIFGYAKELLLVTEVTPPSDLAAGTPVEFGAEVTWLACEEACIPGSASLTTKLAVETGARTDATWSPVIDAWVRRCPALAGPWSVDASLADQATLLLDLQTAEDTNATLAGASFFPYDQGVIENASPQLLSVIEGPRGRSAYQLRVELARVAPTIPERVRGVLVMDSGGPKPIEVDVPLRRR